MIAIVDYQMGNLRSVQKAFEKVGTQAIVTSDARELMNASHVVLPGVGAFGDAMAELRRRDLVQPLKDIIAANKPFLGICLGLQLLFDVGYEGGMPHEGLGVIPGEVVRFDIDRKLKVPHMGWNTLSIQQPGGIFEGLSPDPSVYFVHSYHVVPRDHSVIATTTDYGGEFTSSIARGNLVATQFHPEKSQAVGLRMLSNFATRLAATR